MKAITGYEKWFITEHGEVISRNGRRKKIQDNNGYKCSGFHKNGKTTVLYIHRIVAEAYIPNPESKPCVNHKDFNRGNNHYSNLEWCTYKENELHKRGGVLKSEIDPSNFHDFIAKNYHSLTRREIALKLGLSESALKKYMDTNGLHYSKGYTYEPSRGKYKAMGRLNGKSVMLGRFDTKEKASQAYLNFKKQNPKK